MLTAERKRGHTYVKKIFVFGIFAALLASTAAGQPTPAEKSTFDAVAIRPSAPDARGGGFNVSPGRLNAKNSSLKELVEFAYNLHDYQAVSGGIGGGPIPNIMRLSPLSPATQPTPGALR